MRKQGQGVRLSIATLALAAVAGCAAPVHKNPQLIYYPPPPELPRIQFLTSLSGSKDVETQSAFNRFVVGEKQDVKLDKPYGVAMFEDKIYVCDTNATVVVFDLKQKTFAPLKGATGPGRLMQPINISIERDGTKYVADSGRSEVLVFDRNDDFVKAFGFPTPWRPVDAVPLEDRLYVADAQSAVIRVFDKASGAVVKSIGDTGDPSTRLGRPTNLAFDGEGDLYVTDFDRFQVLKFDRDGHFKAKIGEPGDGPGHFARPKGIAVDRAGRLLAVDASFANVQIFDRDGRVLMYFSEGGEKPGNLRLPAKVAVDYENLDDFQELFGPGFKAEYLILVTSQFGPHAVSVFAYGQEKGKTYPTEEELKRQIEEQKKKATQLPSTTEPAKPPSP